MLLHLCLHMYSNDIFQSDPFRPWDRQRRRMCLCAQDRAESQKKAAAMINVWTGDIYRRAVLGRVVDLRAGIHPGCGCKIPCCFKDHRLCGMDQQWPYSLSISQDPKLTFRQVRIPTCCSGICHTSYVACVLGDGEIQPVVWTTRCRGVKG